MCKVKKAKKNVKLNAEVTERYQIRLMPLMQIGLSPLKHCKLPHCHIRRDLQLSQTQKRLVSLKPHQNFLKNK